MRRIKFLGTWRGTGQRRRLNDLNDTPGKNGITLFTSDWGTSTPRIAGSYTVVLTPFPAATPNTDLTAVVTSAGQGVRVSLPPGTAALVARGTAAAKLQAEAAVGTTLTLRLILQPDWSTVADAIGGGPALVRDGRPDLPLERGVHDAADRPAPSPHGGRPDSPTAGSSSSSPTVASRGTRWA